MSERLLRVMDQVRIIQESSQTTNELLTDRIQDAFSDIKRWVDGVRFVLHPRKILSSVSVDVAVLRAMITYL